MNLNIKKFAELTGVSVRTLHHYDEIELLVPDFVDEDNGYRYYSEKALNTMQEILFYRELDFSLESIKEIMYSPNYNKKEALYAQKQLLVAKRNRLDKIIQSIDDAYDGKETVNFNVFDRTEYNSMIEQYEKEAKKRWGETEAYKEYESKTASQSLKEQKQNADGLYAIISEFAELVKSGVSEDDEKTFSLCAKLQNHITETQYTCTDEILYCLGEMYVADLRFKRNIDKYGEGTADFIHHSINEYCKSRGMKL